MAKTIKELLSEDDRAKLEAYRDGLKDNPFTPSQEEYLEFINETLEDEKNTIDPYFNTNSK